MLRHNHLRGCDINKTRLLCPIRRPLDPAWSTCILRDESLWDGTGRIPVWRLPRMRPFRSSNSLFALDCALLLTTVHPLTANTREFRPGLKVSTAALLPSSTSPRGLARPDLLE